MLKSTFIHLPGLGVGTERRLWDRGIVDWSCFLEAGSIPGLSRARKAAWDDRLRQDLDRLDDLDYWTAALPVNEHWRLFNRFAHKTAYLDIETDGQAVDQGGEVTVIGLHKDNEFRAFVNGINLEEFEDALVGVGVLVTFNGSCFDLPVLKSYIRGLQLPPGGIDLRFALARLGVKGGLKKIEPLFGLRRQDEVDGLDGWEAVRLWRRYLNGDSAALDLLISYNREDTVNLEVIMKRTYNRLRYDCLGLHA